MSCHIDFLPPEIQCLILKQMSNMKPLYALINASAIFFQVYRRDKTAILSHVSWNRIPAAILPIALVLEQRKLRYYTRTKCDYTGAVKYVKSFDQPPPRQICDFSPDAFEQLLEFHDHVEYFIAKFAADRLAIMESYLELTDPHESPSHGHLVTPEAKMRPDFALSETEHFRLARAFYHIGFTGQAFPTTCSLFDDYEHEKRMIRFCSNHLSNWEKEELICVWDYFNEKLQDVVDKCDDDFMEFYLLDKPYIIEPEGTNNRWWKDDKFFSFDYSVFHRKNWMGSYAPRSFRELKILLSADTPKARSDALTKQPAHTRNGLGRVLNIISRQPPRRTRDYFGTWRPGMEFHDSFEDGNVGWFWGLKTMEDLRCIDSYGNDQISNGLRRIGYVMWDYERLKTLGMLDRKPSDVSMDCQRFRRRRPSVEKRTRIQEKIWLKEGLISTETVNTKST